MGALFVGTWLDLAGCRSPHEASLFLARVLAFHFFSCPHVHWVAAIGSVADRPRIGRKPLTASECLSFV